MTKHNFAQDVAGVAKRALAALSDESVKYSIISKGCVGSGFTFEVIERPQSQQEERLRRERSRKEVVVN